MSQENPAAAPGSAPVVEVVGVSKRFGKVVALQDVNLAVYPGEFLTLLGPSGCGKTTLLRIIAGFETPTAGDILLAGQRVNDGAASARGCGSTAGGSTPQACSVCCWRSSLLRWPARRRSGGWSGG